MMIQRPSLQSLLIHMQFNGTVLGSGTGFIVKKGSGTFLITNRHNVTGRRQDNNEVISKHAAVPNEIKIMHHVKHDHGFDWSGRVEKLLDIDGNRLWHEHPKYGALVDFVALELSNLDDVICHPYDLESDGSIGFLHGLNVSISPASTVSVIGFPFGFSAGGLFAIWATGFVASEMDVDINGLPVFYIDCRARRGQSGSPVVFHASGSIPVAGGGFVSIGGSYTKLLGIYSGRLNDESDLGMVWKVGAIKELVDSI